LSARRARPPGAPRGGRRRRGSESTVHTVGHGTRTTEALVEALRAAGVAGVVDVRRFPGSRRHPHLGREALGASLAAAGLEYWWRGEALGGRRRAIEGASRHPAWRVRAFRDYAAWMEHDEFRTALLELEALAATTPLAVLCAETLWWRCHRRLIADALVVRGHEVLHILGPGEARPHPLHPQLRVARGWPVYDLPEG
jgi:uncharacterized protein (DUF488 family)